MAMKQINVAEATGPALDWLVAISNGIPPEELYVQSWGGYAQPSLYRRNRDENGKLDGTYTTGPDMLFSRKWEAGGPIIEREKIDVEYAACIQDWRAVHPHHHLDIKRPASAHGDTALVAAMRAYVIAKLGPIAKVPEELL